MSGSGGGNVERMDYVLGLSALHHAPLTKHPRLSAATGPLTLREG